MGTCGSSDTTATDEQHKREEEDPFTEPLLDGKYLLNPKAVGHGDTSKVFLAREVATGQVLAVKRLRRRSAKLMALYRHEFEVMEVLRQKGYQEHNIIGIHDHFEDDEYANVVMECCSGGELFDRIVARRSEKKDKNKPLYCEHDAALMFKDIMTAVAFLHEQGFAHRDLKPENMLFVTEDMDSPLRLVDLAPVVRVGDDETTAWFEGVMYYMAPELTHKRKRGRHTGKELRQADVWSCGVILYTLLHGHPPFSAPSTKALKRAIRAGKYKINANLGLSEAAQDLLAKLLAVDGSERLTAAEVLTHPWIGDHQHVDEISLDNVLLDLHEFNHGCKIRRALGRFLANNMHEEDREELARTFAKFDANGNGRLDSDELAELMRYIGRPVGDAEQLLADFDEDQDGELDLSEFAAAREAEHVAEDHESAKASFAMLDEDGDGALSLDEITRICTLTPEQFRELDQNGDGKLQFDEWLAVVGKVSSGDSGGGEDE